MANKSKKNKKNKLHIKSGDQVQVLSGAYKGTVSEVLRAFPKEGKVIVKDVNVVTKHQKPNQANQQGGIIEKEAKIDASNVLLYCHKCDKGVRTKKVLNPDGTKSRVCRKCGTNLDL